jgi:hypothetical protein
MKYRRPDSRDTNAPEIAGFGPLECWMPSTRSTRGVVTGFRLTTVTYQEVTALLDPRAVRFGLRVGSRDTVVIQPVRREKYRRSRIGAGARPQ